MTLGNMRANGVRVLGVWCSGRGRACGAGIYHPKPRVMLIMPITFLLSSLPR
jgi:hypothetical protein